MSEKIKRYDHEWDVDGWSGMTEYPDGDYVRSEDHDTALAAKEARIAELERRMRPMPPSNFELTDQEQFIRRRADEIFDENQEDEQADDYMYMDEKMCREAAAIEWGAMQAVAAQQQSEPATHSEDGREVPEVVGSLIDGEFFHCVQNGPGNNPLMTVAQHSRIVAAKEAELKKVKADRAACWAEFKVMTRSCLDAEKEREQLRDELEQLRAQPARQVGGDEREIISGTIGFEFADGELQTVNAEDLLRLAAAFRAALAPAAVCVIPEALRLLELLGLVAEKAFHLADGTQEDLTGETPVFTIDSDDFRALSDAFDKCDDEPEFDDAYVRDGWLTVLDRLRAMLTPSVLVLPSKKSGENLPDYQWQKVQSYNAALDEVARLNRRAIPAGLLERVCAIAECEGQPEGDELRALLGKGD